MPLLTISIKEEDLQKRTIVLLERPYAFTHLKLLHIYHNIDAINLKDAPDGSTNNAQQVQLFIRLGGLVENSRQIINYVGDYDSMVSQYIVKKNSDSGYVLGNATVVNNPKSVATTMASNNTTRRHANIEVNHLIPIGASKHNSSELISRDLFKELHKEGVLNFNGELEFELFFMDYSGAIKPVTADSGGIVINSAAIKQHVTYLTLMFEYEE